MTTLEATLSPTVDIRSGISRPITYIICTILLGNFLFVFHEPGVSFGVFIFFIAALTLLSRKAVPTNSFHWAAYGLLFMSCLQSARFLSLSNFLVSVTLLLCLSGHSAYAKQPELWVRWFEGMLSAVRPIGALGTLRVLENQRPVSRGTHRAKLRYAFAVGFPVVFLLLLFGWLLDSGNAVLQKWNAIFFANLGKYFFSIQLPSAGRIVLSCLFGGIALVMVCPPKASRFSNWLPKPWKAFGLQSGKLRLHQWIASLVALNLLFLFSNLVDVVYLWFSRELPAGISHSSYVHQGVYALIATTLLSALVMALLTQHQELVSKNKLVRGLTFLWMTQNIVLISGVYVRLWIYVDAYGHTPKRAYVALFLALVVAGYGFLGWAIWKYRNIKWLIGANLVLVFSYFSLLQFVDVKQWVVNQNVDLYADGNIEYPSHQFFSQVGSHSIPFLISIHDKSRSEIEKSEALKDLETQRNHMLLYQSRSWRSFQLRDSQNYVILENFIAEHAYH